MNKISLAKYELIEKRINSKKWKIVVLGFVTALTFLIMGVIGYFTNIVFSVMIYTSGTIEPVRGLLYPFESETREVRSLDGVWTFLKSDPNKPTEGIDKRWFTKDLSEVGTTIPMPVPASYNDVTEDMSLRDHVGTVWYERKFFVPKSWRQDQLVWIRFGSAQYSAIVWINGEQVVEHSIGHLPFEAEISSNLNFGQQNRITVLVDNVLLSTTIPQGSVRNVDTENGKQKVQQYTFDFFNYAGIHRSVHLYTTPKQFYIEDVEINSGFVESTGVLTYTVTANATDADKVQATVNVIDKNGTVVGSQTAPVNVKNEILIKNVLPWWPYLMHPDPGYLYTLEIRLSAPAEQDFDVYRMKFGFRTISWTATQFLINGKPVYFRGFGRHEDSDIRGKGLDNALLTKDFSLLKWIGANAYRTSHYPYSEESMQFADENGIMIVDECSSVDTTEFTSVLLENHKSALLQLIHRDRNHPSVVMWSVANEPRTADLRAGEYFKEVVKFTKSLDPNRPVTAALNVGVFQDLAGQYMDIISFNRYNGWYQNAGLLDTVTKGVIKEAKEWNAKHTKPVLMSEYGADTLEGLHFAPAYIWSEEYQNEILSRHFKAFDQLRDQNFFIGEFIWNFADFKTAQTYTRVGGNKKGIFTRNRQPKESAHLVRKRYHALAHSLDGAPMPSDLEYYILNIGNSSAISKLKQDFF